MMKKIGFTAECYTETSQSESSYKKSCDNNEPETSQPVKSLIEVFFRDCNRTLTYYNDMFTLNKGDFVYVEGAYEGMLGCITNVNHNFKIRISDYKKVISVVDTSVKGTLYISASHLIAFDRDVIPYEKVVRWFLPPAPIDDDFVSNTDGTSFSIHDLSEMEVVPQIAERGYNYYSENRVCYINIDGDCGRAIVEGGLPYELEFKFRDDLISDLTCTCPCAVTCKHEFAAMLQLQETLDTITNYIPYKDELNRTGHFAAISKGALLRFANNNRKRGSVILG